MSDSRDGGLVPDPKDTVFCLYQDDVDGFAACWVLRKAAHALHVPVEFTTKVAEEDKFDGRNVVIIGNSVVEGDGIDFIKQGAKSVLLFTTDTDTAGPAPLPIDEWKREFPYGIESFAQEPAKVGAVAGGSLASSAWDFFYASRKGFDRTPRLIDQVQDYVSGACKYNDSRAVYECVDSYDRTFPPTTSWRKRSTIVAAGTS